MFVALFSAAVAGLVASPHCAAMCGPLCARACGKEERPGLARFLVGRLVSYTVVGALAGGAGAAVVALVWGGPSSTILSLVLAATLLAAAARVWPGRKRAQPSSQAPPVPLGKRVPRVPLMARAARALPARPEVLGALTAILPCAALWSGVAIAAATGTVVAGGLSLGVFALASSLGLVLSSWFARRARHSPLGSRLLAGALVLGALLCLWRPIHFASNATAPQPSCPLHPEGM